MKRVNIVAVGKIKESFIKDGIKEYAKRLQRFCSFNITELEDYPDYSDAIERESRNVVKSISGGYNILLDIHGAAYSSEELASKLDGIYSLGESCINFVIGGSKGVNSAVKEACKLSISFGKVTYPHQLMRLILSEQIYRAFTISEGLPYHK